MTIRVSRAYELQWDSFISNRRTRYRGCLRLTHSVNVVTSICLFSRYLSVTQFPVLVQPQVAIWLCADTIRSSCISGQFTIGSGQWIKHRLSFNARRAGETNFSKCFAYNYWFIYSDTSCINRSLNSQRHVLLAADKYRWKLQDQ